MCFGQRFEDAGLITAKRPATLQDEDTMSVHGVIGIPHQFRSLSVEM
jgi:hypothetical protein